MVTLLCDAEIYTAVLSGIIPEAKKSVWIGTSDLKDLHIPVGRRRAIPFLQVLSELVSAGVSLRLIHAKEPGPNFRNDFDRFPNLIEGLERLLCPRVHFKMVIVDQKIAYTGSANLTGAGMGAKAATTRNFESGILTDDATVVQGLITQYDNVWMGAHCTKCKRKEFCSEYNEML